jgi:hypothetical protein
VVTGNIPNKDVVLVPPLNVTRVGDTWLGDVTDGSNLVATFTVTDETGGVAGLADTILVFVTSWDVQPSTPTDVTSSALIEDLSGGLYRVTLPVNTASPEFSGTGIHYSLDVMVGGTMMGYGFNLIRGTVYTVSGYVTDPTDAPVVGAHVGLWNATFGFGDDTDDTGYYEISAPPGTYEFGVDPTATNPGLGIYYNSTFPVSGNVSFDIQLPVSSTST